MRKHAISYAIIRFQPHVETEEFANIGIIAVAPSLGHLDFKLETKRFGRLNKFFDCVDPELIRQVIKNYNYELKRIRDLSGHNGSGQTRLEFSINDNAEHLFNSLTKDREGIIRFSDVRFAMTNNFKAKLDDLFNYYVRKNFANAVYREGLLEKHVRNILKLKELNKNFRRQTFGDGLYSATFPFVEILNEEPVKILKPIYLGQEDPTRILDHSNKWLFTIKRLKSFIPKDVVFAVEGPNGKPLQERAFKEAIDQFKANNIQVVDAKDERELISAVK